MAGQKPGKMLELAMSTIPCAKKKWLDWMKILFVE